MQREKPRELAPAPHRWRPTGASRLAALVAWATACGEPAPPPSPEASPPARAAGAPGEEAAAPDQAGEPVDVAGLARRVAAAAKENAAAAAQARKAAIAEVKEGSAVVTQLLAGQGSRFYDAAGNPTPEAEAVLQLVAAVERHGVATRPYAFARVDAATGAVVTAFAAERALALKVGAKDPQVARVVAAAAAWLRQGTGSELALVEAGADRLADEDLAAIAAELPALAHASRESALALVAADAEVARVAVRYLIDFTLARPLHPHQPTPAAAVRRLAETRAADLIARVNAHPQDLAAVMRASWPTHPQYAALRQAEERYQKLVAAGGWQALPPLPTPKVELGAGGPFVTALRARLRAEGYELTEGDRYDAAVVEAVTRFQRLHQVEEDGVVAAATWRELNVTAADRLRQIHLALGRWREAYARDAEDFHVWVDVAAQRMQVWEHGKPIRSHRAIIGKDGDDIDYERKIKGKINRTKLFGAKMSKITLAPRWYPTQRVIDIELGPALAKDPDYYEKHGYVSEMKGDGSETVYQRSGPTNLLGVVKFQFPNEHAIYMHDTPSKHLFRKARRAYSHGCIRLEQPLALANYLLARDKGWLPSKIKKIIDDKEEQVVPLKTAIPVYLDYVTVTVEQDGEVAFWGDIYGYDRAALTGQLPVTESEPYKPASTRGLL